jgi:hypothetical protein
MECVGLSDKTLQITTVFMKLLKILKLKLTTMIVAKEKSLSIQR